MLIKHISEENRKEMNQFLEEHWFSTDMVIRGRVIDMTGVEGYAAYEEGEIVGLVTYEIIEGECEILSLDSLEENRGIGSELVKAVIEGAKKEKCHKIKLITTNDNMNAIKFYQKRGFDMTRIYHNAVEGARKLKPSIPLVGDFGIPLKHEIEFEMEL